ncbi:MAG: alpha/beta hydrolase, partial [Alphaproteobacteria bacterium]|nr:alpha/beta hydrolase [Alphaproteobacteria bacterium]
MIWTGALAAGAVYGGAVAALYAFQSRLMYPGSEPTPPPRAVGLRDVEEVRVETRDGLSLLAWWQKPEPGRPTVLYFHGNAGSLASRAVKFAHFAEAGYGLLMPAYRGYSGNAGQASEAALVRDAQAATDWLAREAPDTPLIYFGESLGSSVALHLAPRVRPRAIVLEGAFDSAANLAQARYPMFPAARLIRDRWDSLAVAPACKAPVLMLHGGMDKTVPIAHAMRLFHEL